MGSPGPFINLGDLVCSFDIDNAFLLPVHDHLKDLHIHFVLPLSLIHAIIVLAFEFGLILLPRYQTISDGCIPRQHALAINYELRAHRCLLTVPSCLTEIERALYWAFYLLVLLVELLDGLVLHGRKVLPLRDVLGS